MDEVLRAQARQFETGRRRQPLKTQRIVFLVVAAAAPLAAMMGNLPIALGRGNGAGTPGAYLFAGLVLLLFAIGYAAMSRRVVNSGAFYTYVARGLGRPPGVAAAFVALLAYISFTFGMAAFFGYVVDAMLTTIGVPGPWLAYSVAGLLAIAWLGYRSIDLSSRILGILMIAEVAVLAIFDVSVLLSRGAAALPFDAFAPQTVFVPGLGVSLMFAFTSFVGFESAALYGEEARDPRRSVPVATYAAVLLIGTFYLLTAWITVGAIPRETLAARTASDGGMLIYKLLVHYSGETVAGVTALLLCTSVLASYLALHNAASRYIFVLARDRLLPAPLGRFHPRRYAPSNASLLVSGLTALSLIALGVTQLDPYRAGMPVLIGFGTLGIVLLQALAGFAIVAYFVRRRGAGIGTLIAASLGAVGLSLATALATLNFDLLTTSQLAWVPWLPLVYLLAMLAGVAYALRLRRAQPKLYDALAQSDLRTDSARRAHTVPTRYDGSWCIVGGGPCGLLAARAFKLAGIPYEQFERHADVGGIWDLDNPGSSMYESAHFISSKYTSGFYGMPMPDQFPDYPSHRQILSYIRDFADTYGLRSAIRFGVEVRDAQPLGEGACDGWRVTLSTGETRVYRGLVCANGVTWHPNRPQYPGLDQFAGEVRHTVDYRSADALRGRRVLIIGAGNSGVDIACDAARHAQSAVISLRRGYHFIPKHIFGVPTDVFLAGGVHPPDGVVIPDDPQKMMAALVGDLTRYGLPAPDHQVMESHPIMNSQILHYLAHGDLRAQGEVRSFTRDGVIFADGTQECFDLVLFATGYEYRIPYLDERLFTWKQGHPELYLNIFHRQLQGLAVVGFVEFASAGYQRFDEIAQMAAMDACLMQSPREGDAWRAMKAEHRPNLRGEMQYIDSPRHANYVDVRVYRRVLAEIRERFGWPDPDHGLYEGLRARDGTASRVPAAA
ncbi:amino acid permease [Solimonas marina]|uniref:Amino acid permease n=1 Tax=Solimonas marina TaxID=2714601 RepID=A0A969WCP6_9GAMM|nr:amino acid permease [Solimonas marina]NKF23680.1 amino acid permease [Solimonas marina]